jgi:hypothetical protein
VKAATLAGWGQLVELTSQLGAALMGLGVVGVSVATAVKLPHWWWGLIIFVGCYAILFGEGAYRVWRKAVEEANTMGGALDATIAERDRLREAPVEQSHRELMREVLRSLQQSILAHSSTGLGQNESEAFAAHFGALVPLVEDWNAAVNRLAAAPARVLEWLEAECRRCGLTLPSYQPEAVGTVLQHRLLALDPADGLQVLQGWSPVPAPGGHRELLSLRDDQLATPLATLDSEPAETFPDRMRDTTRPIEDLFRRAQGSGAMAELATARTKVDALVHPANAQVMLHLAATLYPADGCPFCDVQEHHRTGGTWSGRRARDPA